MNPKKAPEHRTERDPIGEKEVPAGVLYGRTAVGTGTNASPEYATLAIANLRDITGLELKESKQRGVATESWRSAGTLRGFILFVSRTIENSKGFMGAAELAKKAMDTGKSVKEVVAEE